MPAKVKVRILAGRNLPVMDKSSDASDAFVEVKLGNTTYKTEVYRRSLNPFWNSEWFRFEVSDQELQDEPLQIRVMDYDTYSANDAIGKVYINLNPLLLNPCRSMSGWLPIYDTLHGIRGEINCMVKVNLFADNNRYRHSSCGVRFFFSDIPNGYRCDAILGFVDELLVNDDPEYQWIDKIRTPRASNEARQTLFTKLSGEVQRKLGMKAEIFGGNAVIGYQQSFDLEGGSGIVGRGIGTAVVLSKIGFPYEGIISPLQADNHLIPYTYQFRDTFSKSCTGRDRSTSQCYNVQRKVRSGKHLVHSMSAEKHSSLRDQQLSISDNLGENALDDQENDEGCIIKSGNVKEGQSSLPITQSPRNAKFPANTSSNFTIITNQRRRRDKSQSPTIDDALSTIEEKFDDDEMHVNQIPRARLLSGSSSKFRQIIRAKEIDLMDESESEGLSGLRVKKMSVSSMDDDEAYDASVNVDLNATNTYTSIAETKNIDPTQSTSSPISSILTDETVKAKLVSVPKDSKLSEKSTKDIAFKFDIEQESLEYENSSQPNKILPKKHINEVNYRAESPVNCTTQVDLMRRISPDSDWQSSKQIQHKHQSGSANFVKSVRAIRAQQHLLQNMIKHQNQNLVSSSILKAKNAFIYPNRIHQSEYPFVTLKRFPENSVQCTGGVVSVHSVKLLDHIMNDEESETRDIWWTEIRKEIRSHARALNCNSILGYSETSKTVGDVCILSACGTAAVMKPIEPANTNSSDHQKTLDNQDDEVSRSGKQLLKALLIPRSVIRSPSPDPCDFLPRDRTKSNINKNSQFETTKCVSSASASVTQSEAMREENDQELDCSFCHTPLACVESISGLSNCTICQASKVPDILLLTIEPPQNLNIVSHGSLVQARVCRQKKDLHGEASAKEICDALPFLEYELHRQLFGKLKIRGLNCLFNLNVDITVGENMLTGIATGTGCFVLGLPIPTPLQITAGKGTNTSRLIEIRQLIEVSAQKYRDKLGLDRIESQLALYHERTRHGKLARNSPVTFQTTHDNFEEAGHSNLEENCLSSVDRADSINEGHQSNSSNRNGSTKASIKGGFHNRSNNWRQSQTAGNVPNLVADNNNIILEVDDKEDADIITRLVDTDVPDGYFICNSESVLRLEQPSITSINMFTQVMRAKLNSLDQFAQQFEWILQSLFVKLRRTLPCCLSNISFVVDLPESQVVQISVNGCLLALRRPSKDQPDDFKNKDRQLLDSSYSSPSSTGPSSSSSSSGSESIASTPDSSCSPEVIAANKSTSVPQPSLSVSSDESKRQANPIVAMPASANLEIYPLPEKQSPKAAEQLMASLAAYNKKAPVRLVRAVFKKQQTYPGANAPQIMGQDNPISDQTSGGSVRNRASFLLSRVKQSPWRDQTPIQAPKPEESVKEKKTARDQNLNQVSPEQSMPGPSNRVTKEFRTTITTERGIDITSLSYIPGAKEYQYLGNLSFSFVRETNSVRENDGLNAFIHCFLMDVYAIVRAHVSALGGNAFLSFRLQQSCIFYQNNKNQAQCLISVAGDAANVSL